MNVEYTLFSVEFKQRTHDGKWVKWGRVVDFDNVYEYTAENGRKVKLLPMKWVILNVYDYEIEFTD